MRSVLWLSAMMMTAGSVAAYAQSGAMMNNNAAMGSGTVVAQTVDPATQPAPQVPVVVPEKVAEEDISKDGNAPAVNAIMPETTPAEMIHSEGGGAIPALPLKIHVVNNIKYVTGGVGDEELAQLKSLEGEYNVQLLLAGKDGAYIGGAFLRVLDMNGAELLTADKAGPYFYVALNPGRYTLEVTARQGGIKKVNIQVPTKGVTKPIMRFTE